MITRKANKITQLSYHPSTWPLEDCMKQQIQIKDVGDCEIKFPSIFALPLTLELDVVVLLFYKNV